MSKNSAKQNIAQTLEWLKYMRIKTGITPKKRKVARKQQLISGYTQKYDPINLRMSQDIEIR